MSELLTDLERTELQRAIAESDIAGCSLNNEDIDALVGLFESWLEWRHLCLTDEVVENYLRELPWSDEATEQEKTLVAGNIRGFASHLRREANHD